MRSSKTLAGGLPAQSGNGGAGLAPRKNFAALL